MLPERDKLTRVYRVLPHRRFSYIGNSALTGAYIALLSREHRRRLKEIASRLTCVDLS
ncbi:MAG: ASKHA domain-containing protein [Bryobacteraceae bacterium]